MAIVEAPRLAAHVFLMGIHVAATRRSVPEPWATGARHRLFPAVQLRRISRSLRV